jgi:lysophospholipase L1-like esterase
LVNEIKKRGATATTLNGGIGGTGSIYGAYRVGAQVLSQKPDLLIIEFAVNDDAAASNDAIDGMEGIVRQALKQNPEMGIVFFYTTTAVYQDTYFSKELLPHAVAAHHSVALHYGITEAIAGPAVDQGLRDGKFTNATFFKDGVHPSDIGHALYAKVLTDAILRGFDQPAPASPKPLPAPLGTGKYEYAQLTPITPVGTSDGWTSPATKPWNWINVGIWTCDTVGKPLSLAISGQSIQLIFMGKLDVHWTANGQKQDKILTGPTQLTPMPASWNLSADSIKPDDGMLTVEAVPDAAGKVHGEVWGVYSISPAK